MIRQASAKARFRLVLSISLIALSGLATTCLAHPAHLAAAQVKILPDGGFVVHARFDLLAFALNDIPARIDDESMNQLLDGPADVLGRHLDEARERFVHDLILQTPQGSGVLDIASVTFPRVADVHQWRGAKGSAQLPVMGDVSLRGQLPATANAVQVWFPEALGPIILSVERPGEEPFACPIAEGEASSILPLRLSAAIASSGPPVPQPGIAQSALKYLALGFRHILPHGPDHILFVLGLFLLSTRLRPLLWQVTAFTAAHSLTLGLSLYGVVRLPPIVVEPLIAMSIAFVAVENLFTADLKPWRPVVVFGFGLIHGLGFAGVLLDVGLPRSQFATALLTFNLGVELGQLAVIALALAVVGWLRNCQWYRRGVALPASTAIAAVAIFWTIERIWT